MTTLSWAGGMDRSRARRLLQDYGVYAALLLLFVVAVALNGSFIEMSNLRAQLLQVTPVLVVALGMSLVIGTEGIDLSVGAVIALAAAVLPLYLGYGFGASLVVALVVGAVSGALGGAMVAFVRVQPIVATLSLMIGLRGLANIINGSSGKPVTDSTVADLGTGNLAGIPVMTWIAVVCTVLTALVVRRTTFGRQLVAIGDNRQAARLAGLPVRRVLMTVYIVSGVLAALAGVMLVGYSAESDPSTVGLNYELNAITAVVVGGTPLTGGRVRVLGTVAGALLMQLISAVLQQHNIHQSYQQIIEAALICFAVYAAQERGTR
ncbi:ABC transporter permease [Phaeacidiphilus oryzae]|uniref:ABC transporter permease n=1 Tax=Phaeacidiphilus oryzae TaxID=348818 RepID=UPI0005650BA3|nr:ABC transporter permease [Phaeacidiphilus oryzae]